MFEVAAKAKPSEPPDLLMMLLTIPMTSPFKLNTGLPELPLLIAASVCKNSTAVRVLASLVQCVTTADMPCCQRATETVGSPDHKYLISHVYLVGIS